MLLALHKTRKNRARRIRTCDKSRKGGPERSQMVAERRAVPQRIWPNRRFFNIFAIRGIREFGYNQECPNGAPSGKAMVVGQAENTADLYLKLVFSGFAVLVGSGGAISDQFLGSLVGLRLPSRRGRSTLIQIPSQSRSSNSADCANAV